MKGALFFSRPFYLKANRTGWASRALNGAESGDSTIPRALVKKHGCGEGVYCRSPISYCM